MIVVAYLNRGILVADATAESAIVIRCRIPANQKIVACVGQERAGA